VREALSEAGARLDTQVGRFGMVGRSAGMQRVFSTIERVAPVDLPVLIEGESGTGKEMVARAIHEGSGRRDRPMVSLNCSAVPEGLLESELFGHVRGAFTGADRDREGLFVAARGGTLFLDEIGDMPPRMQVDLLRVLQERRVRPVGSDRDVDVDARLLLASRTPLGDLVNAGRFREDLFYRLNVVTVRLPPLRERLEDMPPLVEHLLGGIAVRTRMARKTVSPRAMRRLREHSWPGNVRQLEHALTHAHLLCDGEVIDEGDLALDQDPARTAAPPPPGTVAQRRMQERRKIIEALEAAGWNRSHACERIGMPRRTFYRRLREYGIL
jgi:DNA-binding NtrC family response regulator